MAREAIARTPLPAAGIDVTDSENFDTLATGSENGVEFTFNARDILILNNGTANPATYSISVLTPASYAAKGVTIDPVDVVLAAGEIWAYPLSTIFRQADGKVYVDCDEAGDILVLAP